MRLSTKVRVEEIARLLAIPETEVIRRASGNLKVFADCDGIHNQFAADMVELIKSQYAKGESARFILPVGPVGQYPVFAEIIHRERISLKNCWFFYMDENAGSDGCAVSPEHPLSFQGEMRKLWLNDVDPELAIPENQLFFPSEKNIDLLADKIDEVGGIDMCMGGIGIHGHVAFNEPEPGVIISVPRKVKLNDFTITINAIRAGVGGNLEAFPYEAFTLGMKQIMSARKIRLASRNGIPLDWANTALRLTLLGEPGEDYPCTYIKKHSDYIIYSDKDTIKCPEIILKD